MEHQTNTPKTDQAQTSEQDQSISSQTQEVENVVDNQAEGNSIELLEEEIGKEKDKFLRLFAEFENYKKRTTKERLELFKTASQDVIMALLPVLDDFDRALAELSKGENKGVLTGVELIHNKFYKVLSAKGLEEVQAQQGEVFDSEIHEAITQIPAPTPELKGKIIDVVEKGYKLADKIIRFPKVVVGQ